MSAAVESRSLDAWLAEHLDLRACWAAHDGFTCSATFTAHPSKVLPASLTHEWDPMPLSSTYEGMGLVLEAMRKRRLPLVVDCTYDMKEWHVSRGDPFDPDVVVTDASLPLAVALAARAALESEQSR